ncbi:Rossmann-like and DUF2520 domain-containing protein [Bergeyella sp. RCAD1439]|uniref:Rossmann-like and DUF2520 domain-containing protein n=1 Tax=Bergeyella anatis TaxID=3113737 RepID=UPI002E1715C4|nr:DUF2520 domain-containing protein [Bergeyella sp. RCAD1439]
MEIIIIGSGHVAYHMAKNFASNGINVKQLFGRNPQTLRAIAEETGFPFSTEKLEKADLYLICVSDNAVEEVSTQIKNPNALVAHTSGSLPKEILSGTYRKASFYPLQTFSKHKPLDYQNIPVFIEADAPEDQNLLSELAHRFSDKVLITNYHQRRYLHLAAVFACNFANHLFARAKELLDTQNIPFDFLLPLIEETVGKIHTLSPKKAQTGPAVRNDQKVIALHRTLLQNEAQKRIYETMNKAIIEMHAPSKSNSNQSLSKE